MARTSSPQSRQRQRQKLTTTPIDCGAVPKWKIEISGQITKWLRKRHELREKFLSFAARLREVPITKNPRDPVFSFNLHRLSGGDLAGKWAYNLAPNARIILDFDDLGKVIYLNHAGGHDDYKKKSRNRDL